MFVQNMCFFVVKFVSKKYSQSDAYDIFFFMLVFIFSPFLRMMCECLYNTGDENSLPILTIPQ